MGLALPDADALHEILALDSDTLAKRQLAAAVLAGNHARVVELTVSMKVCGQCATACMRPLPRVGSQCLPLGR